MNTTYFLNQIMGNVFNTKTIPPLSKNYYIGLSSTKPQLDGTGVSEPSASTNYARVKLDTLSEPNNGIITNSVAISFDESSANWGTMTYFVIYDSLEAGNLLMYDTLSAPRNVEPTTIVTIKAGSLSLTLSNPS